MSVEETNERLWEIAFDAINYQTGCIETFISQIYVYAINYEDACFKLKTMDLPYLKLTGNSYENKESLEVENKVEELLSSPLSILKDLDYDGVVDWLKISDEEDDIQMCLSLIKQDGGDPRIEAIIEGYLRHKFGSKGEEDLNA